jgi:FAD/FMN-containing dehydrogenase
MARKYGLTIDSLRAAEVVTADGRIRQVSADQHADLFWAIRGGGGNFGVVTHFDFVAATVPSVYAGTIQYHLDDLPMLLKNWRDCLRSAPDELSSTFLLMPAFGDLPPAAGVFACYAGSDGTAATRAVEPLLDHGSLAGHDLAVRPYADILEDAHLPEGVRVVVKNALVDSLGDDVIDAIDAAYAGGRGGAMFVRSLGGAMTRVPRDATAFAHRDAEAMVVAATFLAPDASDADVDTALQPWRPIAELGCGAYTNFLGTATDSDIADIYPPATYERLARVKRAYDPANLFSRNHNISPAG